MKNRLGLAMMFIVTTAVFSIFSGVSDGAFNIALSLLIAVSQGAVALVAAVDIAGGKWVSPLKKRLFAFCPMILMSCVLFPLMWRQFNPDYVAPNAWLDKEFLIARNTLSLFLTFIVARKFAVESLKESPVKNIYAVLYLMFFMMSQTMSAIDLVMRLEYPWASTLFGGYFAVEAVYAGLAVAGINCFFASKKEPDSIEVKSAMRDTALMIFGFSLLWAGLMYSQYLVIWYGNLPEETRFLTDRMSVTPVKELACAVLFALFVIPFIALISRRMKTNRFAVAGASILILAGILAERIFFVAPVLRVNWAVLAVELAVLAVLFSMIVLKKD
ncbi:MAG: hypothetical protein HZA48_10580 [Planctomycetes bacterium]|nr:hypothetical protein [Planctomycetota bacterium]